MYILRSPTLDITPHATPVYCYTHCTIGRAPSPLRWYHIQRLSHQIAHGTVLRERLERLHERAPETPRGRSLDAFLIKTDCVSQCTRSVASKDVRGCGLAEEGTGDQENGLGAYSDKGDERCKEPGGYGEECDLVKKLGGQD